MVATSRFNTHSRILLNLGFYLFFIFCVTDTHAQTATFRLHREASTTAILFQLKTNGPDAASFAIQSANLKNKPVGEYLIKAFDTQSGVPGATGTITAGSTVTFTLWLKRTGSGGTLFPRARLNLNSAAGTTIAVVTGSTALTTTLTKYTLSGTVPANVSLTATDRLYLWVGVNLTAAPTQNSVAELNVEGTLNGNYDSTVTVPLPNPAPSISNVTPNSGAIGASVNVAGTNFGATQGTSTITFNGTAATPTSWNATTIVAPVPAGATTGPVVVTVGGQASNGVTFTVSSSGTIAGTITRASDGAVVSGALVEALQASLIKGSTTSAANGSYSLADLAPGTYDLRTMAIGYQTRIQNVVVVTANNTTTANQSLDSLSSSGEIEYVYDELGRLIAVVTSTDSVTYAYDAVGNLLSISRGPASQISIVEFTPNSGNPGTTVTIYGTAFSSVASENTVQFNGVAATVTSATATRIVTSVPSGASTGPISVTSPAGTATSSTPFIVGTPGAPTITGFTPTIGAVGTPVTITGTNFELSPYSTKAKFNKTLGSITSATTTEIVTSVPTFAASGRMAVETVVGSAVSTDDFFIVPAPRTAADVGMTGRMAINESKVVTIPAPGKIALIVFDGVAGQSVSIGTSNSTISAVGCCSSSKVTIYRPDGTALLPATDFYQVGGGTPSVTLPVNGIYTILVEPFSNLVGSVTLWLSQDLSTPIIINGPSVTLTNLAGQNARLPFSGTAGQWVSVGVSDTTIGAAGCCTTSKVSILKPDGTALLAPFDFYQVGAGTPSVQLPVSGTYYVVVDPINGVAGNATITLSEDLSPPISINGSAVTLTNRIGQNGRLPFSGNAGQWVSVGVSNTTIGAAGCCTTSKVSILKPDGTALLAPFDFYSVGAGTPSVLLPVSGTYHVFVDPVNAVAGNATITLSEDLSPPISINGPAVTLTNRVGQNARLLFSGNAGQWISVGVSDVTIGAVSCCTTSKVSILKPDGTALLAPFDIYQVGAGTPSLQLPTSGTYTIVVDPYNAVAGNATITLSEDLSPAISINGPAVTVTNRVGQNARLFFSGNAGQWVSVGVSDTTIGAVSCCTTSKVSILKPDGTTLLAPLDFYSVGAGTPSLQLPTSGTYSIIVDPYNAVAGVATITLSEDLSPAISIDGPAVTLTNRAGQNARLTFNGTAGQWIGLGVSDVTIGAPSCCTTSKVAIYKPDGTALFALTDFYGPMGTPPLQLPTSGAYTIVVDPYNAVAGNATLTLSEDLSPPISINGGGVTLTNRAGQNARLSFTGNAGQWISLAVTDVTIAAPGCCVSSTVVIYKPDGTALIGPLTIPAAGVTTPSVQLPVSGSYIIVVDPYNAVAGNATVALWEDLSPPISINGPQVVLQFTNVGQNSRLFFSGTAGQWVSVGTSDSTISATGCCSSSTVTLLKPDGTTLLAPFTFFQAGGGTPSVQLPVTGTYALIVEPFNNMLGSVTLWLSEDMAPSISINGPAVVLTNRVGQNARLPFSGNAGQWISVGVSDTTIGASFCCTTSKVSILKPDGTALLAPFDFYQQGTGTPSVQLPVSGIYHVVVDPINGVAGNATITLSEDLSPAISINGPSVVLTNRVGQNARVPFSGNAGQWISVGVSDTTIGASFCCTTSKVSILKPDGTALLAPSDFYQQGTGTPSLQLPVSGTYTIVVDPYLAVAGNATITLSQDLAPPISIDGPTVTLTNRPGQNARLTFSGTAGQPFSLGVTDVTIGAPFCCTTSKVAIYKPDGTPLFAPIDFYGPIGTDTIQLPTSGTYTLIVDPYLAVAGTATITLSEDLVQLMSPGGPSVFMSFRAGQNGGGVWGGTAGRRVTVRVWGNTLGNTTVSLVGPGGMQFTSMTSGGGTFSLLTQTLPTTGTYTVTVNPTTTNTGGLNLLLEDPDLNMALNKTATQSSTNFSAPASRAVDGNTDGNFSAGSVTHTQVENQAWWHVDLGSVQTIGRIDVFNRTDCCGSALTNFYVFVSDVPFTSTDVTATQNQAGVFTYQHSGQGGSPTPVTVNRTGRYIRIQLPGSERLSLAEVQVWP